MGEGTLGPILSSGATLTSFNSTIIGAASFSKSGSLDVSNNTTSSGLIGGLPAGSGWVITLSATAG
ncbi:MAG TPA: hypothetical protein VFK05_32700 [Polyangiaceae bacterium]|nr:hypothetical protein [Polyangiaceae bacterium]